MEEYIFYSFALLALSSALMVISSRSAIQAVLFLVLAFFSMAAEWLLLEAEFLAIALVLIYVGAVMVLFLFVIMMLDLELSLNKQVFVKHFPLALAISGLLLYVLLSGLDIAMSSSYLLAVDGQHLAINKAVNNIEANNIVVLGMALYTNYLYQFELAGIILLVAIIAAISLTFKGGSKDKTQDISLQLDANKQNRLKIIKMDLVHKGGK